MEAAKSFISSSKTAGWRRDGLRPYFAYRDLGIQKATGGAVLAHIIRAAEPCAGPMGYHSHDLDFQMVYMIKGWARVDLADIGEVRLESGDVLYQAPGVKHEVLEHSDDWEVMEITLPAEFETQDESR